MSRHSLTLPVGTTMQSRAYVMSDADRDRIMETAAALGGNSYVTRPSGEPVPLEKSRAGASQSPWSQREQVAARRLRKLWYDAKIERVAPAGYPSEVCQPYTPKGEDSHPKEAVDAAVQAYREFRAVTNLAEQRLSTRHVYWLRQVGYGEAIPMNASIYAREALGWLADEWRIK
jgi:hypothetical protein